MKVCLFVNHACNLACSYCYNGPKFARPMPWEVARRAVAMGLEQVHHREVQISFFGGEPLLERALIERVVEHAEAEAGRLDKAVRFLLITNGTLVDDAALALFEAHRFYVGVSLDGCRAAHDATRRDAAGHSSHDRAVDGLRRLLGRGGNVGTKVVAVIDPANVDHLADSFDALLGHGARNLGFNVNYEADWDDAARDRFLTALRALGDRYIAAYRRGVAFTLNLLDSKVVTHLKGGYACSDRCDFGCEELAVAPSGRLYPCDRLIGDDTRDDVVIGDVWSGVDAARRDALIDAKNRVLTDCGDCALVGRCMHWCGCVNHAMTGSVGEVSGLLCWFEQALVEEADRCAATLYAERDEGFLRRFYAPRVRAQARASLAPAEEDR